MPPKKPNKTAAAAKAAAKAAAYNDRQQHKNGDTAQPDRAPPAEVPSAAVPPDRASSAAVPSDSRWQGPVNLLRPPDKRDPFEQTKYLMNDVIRGEDPPYLPSPSQSVSSYDSQLSVKIPESELAALLQSQPEVFLQSSQSSVKQQKTKRVKRNVAGAADDYFVDERDLVFNNGDPSADSWPEISKLTASCPDMFGDEDPSPLFDLRADSNVESYDEEMVQDPERDPHINEARKELFGLLLGEMLSLDDELNRYKWFEDAYERSKNSIRDFQRSLSYPACLQSPIQQPRLAGVLSKLVNEGKEYNSDGVQIPSTRNRKINQIFLDCKSSTATTIRFQTKAEFVIFILSIYADSIHDANRIDNQELKTKIINLKKACANNFVAKMYPDVKLRPSNVLKLLSIIGNNGDSFETDLMDHYAVISGCHTINPFDLASALTGDVVFTDNASMKQQVTKDNSVLSIHTLVDAGASNRGKLCFLDQYNVRFIWEAAPNAKNMGGEYYEFLVNQTVSQPSIREGECAYYALDHFKRLSWRTSKGSKMHNKAVVERLPLCSIEGNMRGCFTSIQLRYVAQTAWQQAVKSVGEPDGFSALPLISLKWSGDFSMVLESVLGYRNMCGFLPQIRRRRLPYIVSEDNTVLPGGIEVNSDRYNDIVERNNTNQQVTGEDIKYVNSFLDAIEQKRILISNDRSAHGEVILLLGATLKMDVSDSPVNPHCKSVLVCAGNEEVHTDMHTRVVVRTMNRTPVSRQRNPPPQGTNVESSDDDSCVSSSCAGGSCAGGSWVWALSSYVQHNKTPNIPETQQLLTPSPSPPRTPVRNGSVAPLRLFQVTKVGLFIDFLIRVQQQMDDTDIDINELIKAISRLNVPDSYFDNPNILALQVNAEFSKGKVSTLSENDKNIQSIQTLIERFNLELLKNKNGGGWVFTRSRSRNHRRTQYTNKYKRSTKSTNRATIKHRKSYRKHNRTVKRRKSRRHH